MIILHMHWNWNALPEYSTSVIWLTSQLINPVSKYATLIRTGRHNGHMFSPVHSAQLTSIDHVLAMKFNRTQFHHGTHQIFGRFHIDQWPMLKQHRRTAYAIAPCQQSYNRNVPYVVPARFHRHHRVQQFGHIFLYSMLGRFAHWPEQSFQSSFGTIWISHTE